MLRVQGCNGPVAVLQWHQGQVITDRNQIREASLVAAGDDPRSLENRQKCEADSYRHSRF